MITLFCKDTRISFFVQHIIHYIHIYVYVCVCVYVYICSICEEMKGEDIKDMRNKRRNVKRESYAWGIKTHSAKIFIIYHYNS